MGRPLLLEIARDGINGPIEAENSLRAPAGGVKLRDLLMITMDSTSSSPPIVSLYSRCALAFTLSENLRYSALSGFRSVTVNTASNALRAISLRTAVSLARYHGLASFDLLSKTT